MSRSALACLLLAPVLAGAAGTERQGPAWSWIEAGTQLGTTSLAGRDFDVEGTVVNASAGITPHLALTFAASHNTTDFGTTLGDGDQSLFLVGANGHLPLPAGIDLFAAAALGRIDQAVKNIGYNDAGGATQLRAGVRARPLSWLEAELAWQGLHAFSSKTDSGQLGLRGYATDKLSLGVLHDAASDSETTNITLRYDF